MLHLPNGDPMSGMPYSYVTRDNRVYFHFDTGGYDFHVEAMKGHSPETLAAVLRQANVWGLEVMDECLPEILADGGIRIYLTPIVPAWAKDAYAPRHAVPEQRESTEVRERRPGDTDTFPALKGLFALPVVAAALGWLDALSPVLEIIA